MQPEATVLFFSQNSEEMDSAKATGSIFFQLAKQLENNISNHKVIFINVNGTEEKSFQLFLNVFGTAENYIYL